jgi:putative transposase
MVVFNSLQNGEDSDEKSRFIKEQVTYALRQSEGETAVEDIYRSLGISQVTFYIWKKKYGKLGASEVRRLRQLEDENVRLKRLVADRTLDKDILLETSFRLTSCEVIMALNQAA